MSILDTIDFKTATPEQIEAYAAASREAEAGARAELEARNAAQAEALAGVQSEWRRDVIARHADLDAQLVDEGQEHRRMPDEGRSASRAVTATTLGRKPLAVP